MGIPSVRNSVGSQRDAVDFGQGIPETLFTASGHMGKDYG